MIYTIGKKSFYENYIDTDANPKKLGRLDPDVFLCSGEDYYEGGSVWQTKEEAEQHTQEGYEVYGVIADWKKDTTPSEESHHCLLNSSRLIKI